MANFFKYLSWYPGWLAFFAILCLVMSFLFLRWKARMELRKKKRIVDLFPSALSTLGVLGTFVGITSGLLGFDPANLDESIPILLEGLKTAFYTSIAGMVTSLLANIFINNAYDQLEVDTPSDQEEAARRICESLEALSQQNAQAREAWLQSSHEQAERQTALHETLKEKLAPLALLDEKLSTLSGKTDELIASGRARERGLFVLAKQQEKNADEAGKYLGELLDILSGTATISQETLNETRKFSEVLRGEVDEIENKMRETNLLLERKFEEFAELLRKSNTEALVGVMREATQEFQKQMNAIVSRLVKENFERLNHSVEQLNEWQQENKRMVAELVGQYAAMSEAFGKTSTVLGEVAEYAQSLNGANGQLARLVDELRKVMVEDNKFTTITNKLEETVELTKDNMTQFDASTSKLNDWVRKQRNFVDGVQLLIKKLEELSSIRDYNKEFWSDTKRRLEEGVGLIKAASEELNGQLRNLDKQFYERLSATLAELDACIQTMVINKK